MAASFREGLAVYLGDHRQTVGLGATIAPFGEIIRMGENGVATKTHILAGVTPGDGGVAVWPRFVGRRG